MRLPDWLRRLVASFSDDEGTVTAMKAQSAIEKAIEETGVRLVGSRALTFGSMMVVHISAEAMDALKPVHRTAIRDIEERLPGRLASEGWALASEVLRIEVVRDPRLTGLQVRATPSDMGVTSGRPRVSRNPKDEPDTVRLLQVATGRSWVVPHNRPVLLGRQGTGVEIGIDDSWVSRVHASVEVATNVDGRVRGLMVTDRGSTHGTRVGMRRLGQDAQILARHGEAVILADQVELRVLIGDEASSLTVSARS